MIMRRLRRRRELGDEKVKQIRRKYDEEKVEKEERTWLGGG
jgi:hypothetical protein